MEKKHIKIELDKLKPSEKNPKQHNDDLIEKSIKELGFVEGTIQGLGLIRKIKEGSIIIGRFLLRGFR